MKILIIGAGLSGLVLAQKLSSHHEILVADKARGVGGRLATRRSDAAKFDHGAQFYRLKEPISELHGRWRKAGLVTLWFKEENIEHYCSPQGMTALAKNLASDTTVLLNERVNRIEREGEIWIATFDSGRRERADVIIFTTPVPQALEILEASAVGFAPALKKIGYSKALIALFETDIQGVAFESHGYLEPSNGEIFSIADQFSKGVSSHPALTVTMNPSFSDSYFDREESETIDAISSEIKKIWPSFTAGASQIKKWRYCQVHSGYEKKFAKIADGLYFAGDGFGGASLNGAARSANALFQALSIQEN